MIYLYNGEWTPKEQVHISPDDRGYYFGDGIYEVFRIYGGQLYEAEAHFARLERTAREVDLTLPLTREALESKLIELVTVNNIKEGTLYIQITRGEAPRAHPFPENAKPVLLAYCNHVVRPLAAMRDGISAVALDDIRWLRCDLKTLNLLPNTMAKQHALQRGAAEVVLHRNGVVTECSASNVMIVKDGVLRTHPANHLILHGVTRAVVLRLAREADIRAAEEAFTLEELAQADEAFITGTTVEITPLVSFEGRPIGFGQPGPITRKLQQRFERTIPEW